MSEATTIQKTNVRKAMLPFLEPILIQAVQDRVANLLETDKDFNMIMTSMIVSQQLYQLCRYSLQRECEKRGFAWDQDHIEECIIEAARQNAMQPIHRKKVWDLMQSSVMPFMSQEIAMQQEEERSAHLQRVREQSAIRASVKVPVSLRDNYLELDRGKVVVLVGCRDDVAMELELSRLPASKTWTKEHIETRIVCMALALDNIRDILMAKDAPLMNLKFIGINRWAALANSATKFDREMDVWMKHMFGQRCDLLLVGDATQLYTGGAATRTPIQRAEDALKVLKKWAGEQLSAVLAGLFCENDADLDQFVADVKQELGEYYEVVEVLRA